MIKSKWSEERIVEEIKAISEGVDFMPTSSFLKEIGRNDLMCAITKNGGWVKFSKLSGLDMKKSDTTFGWSGEVSVIEWLESLGYDAYRETTKAPWDILINGLLRVEVKTASYAKYGPSSGWFYRMGKKTPADVVILHRADERDFYVFPWFRVPSTNITITKTGTSHQHYKMNYSVIESMLKRRMEEVGEFPEASSFSK